MWVKLCGAALVFAASTALGQVIAGNIAARPRHLCDLVSALEILGTEIAYAARPLPQALRGAGDGVDGPVGTLLLRAAELVETRPAAVGWRQALAESSRRLALVQKDVGALMALAPVLGRSDRNDQVRHLRLAIERLKRLEVEAEAARARGEQVWRYLGPLCGLGAAVLLL